jgi:hypothetical protein
MSMIIDIEFEESLLTPAGRFQGTCTEVRETDKTTKKGVQKFIRVVFDLDLAEDGVRYRVGRDFPAADIKGFQAILKEWLGKGIVGKSLDLQTLKGRKATLDVVHIPPKHDHEEAFRLVNRILPSEEPLQEAA